MEETFELNVSRSNILKARALQRKGKLPPSEHCAITIAAQEAFNSSFSSAGGKIFGTINGKYVTFEGGEMVLDYMCRFDNGLPVKIRSFVFYIKNEN